MERERGGGDDEVEHEVDGEEVREEARREDVAEDLGQIEHGRVWHDRESERPKTMRSARPDRPGAGRAPATSPAPSVSPKRNGYLLRINQILVYIRYYIPRLLDVATWENWGFFCFAPQDFWVWGVFYARVPPREASLSLE